ncbi:MAG TPA: copper amine oxidase N-terminal domain-containing protein [Epulopiscium sp.]|nr:copper amine oxidase N-terminal domain-containing protein [Candidatus Epulonipiscium sp.]
MKKRLACILIVSIFFINSVSVFSQEPNRIEDELYVEEQINMIEDEKYVGQKSKEMVLQLGSTLAWIDGEEYTLTALPKVIGGSTYLPLRFMTDKLLEADLNWIPATKEIEITKNNKRFKLKIGSKEAFINDTKVGLQNTPIIDNNVTYLPLRSVADLFEIETDYDQASKRITLTKVEETIEIPSNMNKAPIAQFSFDQEGYTHGQIVKAIDESFDEDGNAIINKLWMVNFNEKQATNKLENIFNKPRSGDYQISLKVQDSMGLWSEWATRSITIKPNEKPVVTTLMTSKESYAGGEAIEFTYTYDNEPWENIKAERWTYKQIDESDSKAVADKPKFIFHEGEYVITLKLQDDADNWSVAKEVIVTIDKESKQNELEYRFTQGNVGDIIDNFQDFNYQTYGEVFSDETTFGEGTLLMSDSPEDVKYKGILYRDTVGGIGRILFHHNNMFTEEENALERKRLVLMAENPTDKPVNFIISDKTIKGPATDTLYVGQQLLLEFLRGNGHNSYSLAPGEKMYLYDSGDRKWDRGHLISGQMDFDIDGELKITIAAIGNNTKMNDIVMLPDLGRDVHPRGTYDKINIFHKIELKGNEPAKLLLGTGPEEWIDGYDAITGEIVKNRGNYGVTYSLEITAKEDTGIILNPRAGVFRGAVRWDGTKSYLAPSKGYFTGHNSKAVMLGVIKAGETRRLDYVLPNGSASPVLLGFIPKDHWDQ